VVFHNSFYTQVSRHWRVSALIRTRVPTIKMPRLYLRNTNTIYCLISPLLPPHSDRDISELIDKLSGLLGGDHFGIDRAIGDILNKVIGGVNKRSKATPPEHNLCIWYSTSGKIHAKVDVHVVTLSSTVIFLNIVINLLSFMDRGHILDT